MPDEPSQSELGRRIDRLERDHDTDIAQVRLEHTEDIRRLREDVIKPLRERTTALEQVNAARPGMTFGRWMLALGVVAAFLTVIVTVWATSKGAK